MEDPDKVLSPPHRTADSDKVFQTCQQWIEAVTGKEFRYPGNFRKSLEDGILLCELVNKVKPGSVPHITRLPTHHAHLDNVNQFIAACKDQFGMKGGQIFEATDLEDPARRRASLANMQNHPEGDRKIRNVAVTLYWLGRLSAQRKDYTGPKLDLTAFKDLLGGRDVFQSIVSKQIKISSVVTPPSMPPARLPPTKVTDLLRSKRPPPIAENAVPASSPPSTLGKSATGPASTQRTPTPSSSTSSSSQKSVVTSVDVQELMVPIQSTGTGSFGFQIMGGYETEIPPTVEFIVPGSPADLVHLQRGDVLISVNGELIRSLTHKELVGMIKESGQKGSMVLGVQRRVMVEQVVDPRRDGATPTSPQEKEVTVPNYMGKSGAEPQEAVNAKREEKQEVIKVKAKPQEDPKVKTEPFQIKVKAENLKESGKRSSGPTRVVIHQTVLEHDNTSPLADDISNLEQVEAEMGMLMADMAFASPPPATRQKEPLETTITSKEKGKVKITISKPGKPSPMHKSQLEEEHQMMAAEWVTQSAPPGFGAGLGDGGKKQLSGGGMPAEEEELDTDARIHILEAELEELKKQAGMMGDEELFKTNVAPSWELEDEEEEEEEEEEIPPPEVAVQVQSSPPPKAVSPPREYEDWRNKEEELLSLFATIAESTKLPPAPVKEVAPVPAPAREVTPVLAPAREVAPVPAPAKEVAPVLAPAREVAPVLAPAREVAPVPAPAKEVTPVLAPAREVTPVLAPAKEVAPVPVSSREVTPKVAEEVNVSSTMSSSLHFSPATIQALADREAFLKEQMKQQRRTLNMEWQRLEEERQSLEQRRQEDQSMEAVRKVEVQRRKWTKPDASLQQEPPPQEEPHTWHRTEELQQGRLESDMFGPDQSSTWLALQAQIQEEEKQQQAEIERFEEERRRRAEEERQRAEEERLRIEEERRRVQLQWEEEQKRQEAAKRRMEKEAAWILDLEARKAQEKQERAKEEQLRRTEQEKKLADKATAWIRDLEARRLADRPPPAEEPQLQEEVTAPFFATPPSYSPPPMTEEQRRKAEAIRQFDEMIAQEEARQQQQKQDTSTTGVYNRFSQPLSSSPSSLRASYSPQVETPQSYDLSKSRSYQHIQHMDGTTDGAGKAGQSAAVADVHHTSAPAHRTSSWRELRPSPQPSPAAIKYSKSFQQPQHYPTPVCAVCSCPLGKEPSMSVSNSGLSFHLQCFRCDVCHRSLASGQLSVSILLREGRPHCRHCFSSDAGVMATEC